LPPLSYAKARRSTRPCYDRLSQDRWQYRGDPWGLLLGVDEPLGYDNVPNEFRAFLTWGVDGLHEGLWIDDIDQAHPERHANL
jgi:hypothetical protein